MDGSCSNCRGNLDADPASGAVAVELSANYSMIQVESDRITMLEAFT
jgi:hypothetical protein